MYYKKLFCVAPTIDKDPYKREIVNSILLKPKY